MQPDFPTFALDFFAQLGYTSPLQFNQSLTYAQAVEALELAPTDITRRALDDGQARVHLLFQFTADQLKAQNGLFAAQPDRDLYEAFVFLALDLREGSYSRSDVAALARQFNRPFASPVIVLLRHGQTLSLASVARRPNLSDNDKHVLLKVSMLKDIGIENPHRAHSQILSELEEAKTGARNWTEFFAAWNAVLDISELNRKFYRDYKLVFETVETQVRGIAATATQSQQHRVRDWTQRLFNRLLFLRFLEKKGWLQFDGSPDYLRALWGAPRADGQTFLKDRLYWAFFHGLNANVTPETEQELIKLRGKVPPLNGGLFEMQDDLDNSGAVWFADEKLVFDSILGLFGRYVFTVAENTPLEEEVGVDPEMLGKVFEELVTGRHETGSYYTPRGIVSFMAREAIKGYLAKSGARAAIEKLVDEDDASQLADPEAVLSALREVTICDPACGSGAYLLGTMQELLRLRETLFAAHAKDHQKIYDRKLEIIARNLYGVDKDPFATNIAMLRLWLSLVVEYEGATPPPLPNLKYKIENGDSLAAPLGGQLTLDQGTVDEFNRTKSEFVRAHGEEKTRLDGEVRALRSEIEAWAGQDVAGESEAQREQRKQEQGFDWRIEFAEIFAPGAGRAGGFDIVLANPPFVTNGLIARAYKARMTANLGADRTDKTMDLYCYFYLRGFELLRAGGELAFISPKQWFRAAYGAKLRAFFAQNAHVQTIVEFGELPVFQNAKTFPMIFTARKTATKEATHFTQVKSLAAPYPDVLALVKRDGALLPATAIEGDNWNLHDAATQTRMETMRKSGVPLGEYVKGQIYRGIVTGLNEPFYINGETRSMLISQDPNSADIIKPLVKGDDVRCWRVDDRDRWLIFTRRGTNIENYPAIKAHLEQWKEKLMPKPSDYEGEEKWPGRKSGSYRWFEIQDNIAYFENFGKPKILFPDICRESRFTFDLDKYYVDATASCLVSDSLFLLGLLNSKVIWQFMSEAFAVLGDADKGGRLRLKSFYVEKIPIPNAGTADQSAIASLVEACLSRRGQGCEAQEAEINARVAALYGLDGA